MIAQLSKNLLTVEEQTQLVQGSVGETIRLKRADDWKRMTATAVFSNGELTRDVIVTGETLLIPWELLQEEGRRLTLNFHGAGDGGCIVQTNIASLGRVKKSNSPSGNPPEAPTPARADQIQALAQEAMAAAAAVQAGAASGAFDGVSPQVSVQPVEGGHTVTITDRGGAHSFTVLDGEDGGASLTVDSALSDSSENPVQNKVIKSALDGKADLSDIVPVDDALLPGSENPVQNKVICKLYTTLGANISAVDRLFVAECIYPQQDGSTDFDDVKSAFSRGKYLVCLDSHSGIMYPLLTHQEADAENDIAESFTFGAVSGNEFISFTCSNVADAGEWPPPEVWTHTSVLLPEPAAALPLKDGTAAVGSSAQYARADHRHPTDTSRAAASDLAAKADKITEVTVSTAGAVTQALDAGKIYHFTGAVTALTITLNAPASVDLAQYHFDFNSGSTAATLTMPNTVTMPDSFAVEANKRYEVDVLNNYGAVMAWANS